MTESRILDKVEGARAATLDLPAVSAADREEANELFIRRAPLMLEPEAVALRAKPAAIHQDWRGLWARLDFSVFERPGTLYVPLDAFEARIRKTYPDLQLERLDSEQAALVVEATWRAFLDALAVSVGGDIGIERASFPVKAAPEGALGIEMREGDGEPLPLLLVCHEIERNRLVRDFVKMPPENVRREGLKTSICFRCGYTLISLADYAELEVGGGIVLDATTLGFQKIVAVMGERFVQTCTWQTINPVLDGALLTRGDVSTVFYTTGNHVMDDADDSDSASPTGSVSDVPIHLVFELGRIDISLAQIETLDAGYVFDLVKPLSQSVEILANGRRIGTGELVRLGDNIGVRVARLMK